MLSTYQDAKSNQPSTIFYFGRYDNEQIEVRLKIKRNPFQQISGENVIVFRKTVLLLVVISLSPSQSYSDKVNTTVTIEYQE